MGIKYLIYSDVHWSTYSSIIRSRGNKYSTRLENLIKSVSWAEQLAVTEHCDAIICAGDFYDKPFLQAEEITALKDVSWSNLPHHFIVGNHESNTSSLEYSTTSYFSDQFVYDSPTTVEINSRVDLTFIPYITGDVPSIDNFIKNKNKKNIVCAHQDLAGVQFGRMVSQSGFHIDDIERNCTLFLNGHLHNNSNVAKNIVLIGNLTGQNFNEDAFTFDHGVYILTVEDDGTIYLDRHVNPHAFNFYKINITKQSDLDKLKMLGPNSIVSVSTPNKFYTQVVNLLKNVAGFRANIQYDFDDQLEDVVEFKVENHLKQFIECAKAKFEQSDILDDELSRLGGNAIED